MVKTRRSPTGVEARCLGCRRDYRERLEHPKGVAATNHHVDRAPDPEPAVRLRLALERHRAAGRPLSSAWPAATTEALRGLAPLEAVSWRQTFTATRKPWAAGYDRAGRHALALSSDDLPD